MDYDRRLDRDIARLTLPAILSNVTVPLLGISDTAISGHLGDASFLGAIALGTMMFNVLTWLCGFLRMGTTGLTAVAYGASDVKGEWQTLVRGVAIAVCIGVAVIALQSPLASLFMAVAGGGEGVAGRLATMYFSITVWGMPAILATMAISGWLIGMQTTVWPMIIAVSANVVNILLSLMAVFVLDAGFAGVAYGTLCANYVGLLIAVWTVGRRMRRYDCPPLPELLGRGGWWKYFGVNANLFFRSVCVMGVSVAMTSIGARLGEITLAANAVMMQFFLFFSFVMDGLAYSGEALCGRYWGAGDRKMLLRSVGHLCFWSLLASLIFCGIYSVGSSRIISLLTDVAEVVAETERYSMWLVLLPPLSVGAFIFDGFYIGMIRTRQMLYATLCGITVFILIAMVDFSNGGVVWHLPDNTRLWTAFLAWLFVRGLVLGVLLPRMMRQRA